MIHPLVASLIKDYGKGVDDNFGIHGMAVATNDCKRCSIKDEWFCFGPSHARPMVERGQKPLGGMPAEPGTRLGSIVPGRRLVPRR